MSQDVVVRTPSREKLAARGRAMLRITGTAAVALAVLVCAQGAIAKKQERRTADRHAIPSFARALPPALARTGHWATFHGRRIWEIPLTLQMTRSGTPVAKAANASSQLSNLTTGLCLSGYPTTLGSQMTQWYCNGSQNQQWYLFFNFSFGNTWELLNGDGYCMDNYQNRTTDNNPQINWSCTNGSTIPLTKWVGVSNWSGYYLIHNDKLEGTPSNECVSGLGHGNGTGIVQWLCNRGSSNQAFAGATLGNM